MSENSNEIGFKNSEYVNTPQNDLQQIEQGGKPAKVLQGWK